MSVGKQVERPHEHARRDGSREVGRERVADIRAASRGNGHGLIQREARVAAPVQRIDIVSGSFVFPPHTQIQRQPLAHLKIILQECAGLVCAHLIQAATGRQRGSRGGLDIAQPGGASILRGAQPQEQIGERIERNAAPADSRDVDVVRDSLDVQARSNRMAAPGPGNLIGVFIRLLRSMRAVGAASSDAEQSGNGDDRHHVERRSHRCQTNARRSHLVGRIVRGPQVKQREPSFIDKLRRDHRGQLRGLELRTGQRQSTAAGRLAGIEVGGLRRDGVLLLERQGVLGIDYVIQVRDGLVLAE